MSDYTGDYTQDELKSLRRVGITPEYATLIRFCTGHDAPTIVQNIRSRRWYNRVWRWIVRSRIL